MFPDEEEWASKYQEAENAQKEGKIDFAEATWLVALEEAEAFGPSDSRLAMTLEKVTDFYLFQGKMNEARGYGYRAINIYEESLGPMDSQLGSLLTNMAMLNQVQSNLDEAERLFRRALAINSASFGVSHPKVINLLNSFADVLEKMGRVDEANQLRASSMPKSPGNNNSPAASKSGPIFRTMPNPQALPNPLPSPPGPASAPGVDSGAVPAKNPTSQTVPLPLRTPTQPFIASPPVHKTYAYEPEPARLEPVKTWLQLKEEAEAATRKGDLVSGSKLWIDALNLVRGDGMDNPDYCYSLESLGDIYFQQNELAYAERAFIESRDIKVRVLGKYHVAVGSVFNLLARTYYAQGKMEMAEALARECLDIYEKASGPESVDVASALHNLGTLYHMQNRYPEAENCYNRALSLNQALRGLDDPETVKVMKALAKLLNSIGRHSEAEQFSQTISGTISGRWRPIDVSEGEVPEAGWWKDELFGDS